jgi:hypothetical protein
MAIMVDMGNDKTASGNDKDEDKSYFSITGRGG